MKYLKIVNNGELDIRLVALMGGTTKAGKENLIGNFGSGLKYTLAFLLRNNLSFKIFSGLNEVQIHTETEIIRDESFDIICINGHRTSITANMGKDWLPWMVIREIWSNSLDEGGAYKEITTECVAEEGKTSFYIQIDSQIQKVINEWNKYFIHDMEPLSVKDNYTIYPGGESLRLYKQGVLIYEDDKRPALFSYDLANAPLNELREFTGSISYELCYALSGANERVVKYFLEIIGEEYFEGSELDYTWSFITWGAPWKSVIGDAKLIYPKVIEDHLARGMKIDASNYIVVPKKVYDCLTKQFEGIGALKVAKQGTAFYENYCAKTENRINQALAILESCNYPIHPEIKFSYGFFEDKRTMAEVNFDTKTIYLSQAVLQKPLTDIISILIEEYEHYTTGYSDETREFQTHFIKLYTRALLAQNQVEI